MRGVRVRRALDELRVERGSRFTLSVTAGTTHLIFVEGWGSNEDSTGDFELTLRLE